MLIVAMAAMPVAAYASGEEGELNPQEIIFEHLGDAYGWEVPFSHEHRIPLPIIVNDNAGNWHLFSSARLTDGGTYADGGAVFKIADAGDYSGKVVQVLADGSLKEILNDVDDPDPVRPTETEPVAPEEPDDNLYVKIFVPIAVVIVVAGAVVGIVLGLRAKNKKKAQAKAKKKPENKAVKK